jgi:hypothetical protein
MIIISFPTGCGGNFLGALAALIFKKQHNLIKQDDGSMHLTTNGYHYLIPESSDNGFTSNLNHLKSPDTDIGTVHMKDIKSITETYPDYKVIAVILDKNDLDIQEHNFKTKTIPLMWSEEWYSIYRSDRYPDFDPDISKIPDDIIDDILAINRRHIQEWEYIFPEDMTNVLCINYRELLTGDTLLEKIKHFFELDNLDQSVYYLVNKYRRSQQRII